MTGDNGKLEQKQPFDCFIKIFFNTKTKEYGFETNVPDVVTGYGLCDLAKKGVDSHIAKMQANAIKKPGRIMDFVRGRR